MEFIEKMLNVSPDGGNGLAEATFLILLMSLLVAAACEIARRNGMDSNTSCGPPRYRPRH